MPNLRTRKSAVDSRVTLFSLAGGKEEEAEEAKPGSSSQAHSLSPSTTLRRGSSRLTAVKSEPDDSDNAAPGFATPQKKRSRTSVLKDDSGSDYEEKDLKLEGSASAKASSKKKKSKSATASSPRPASPTKIRAKLEVAHPPPPRWRETYEIIRKQRETIVAAVDLMGCDAIAGSNDIQHTITEKDRRLASLISLMLSSQTKDPVTHDAVMNLRRNLKGGLCLEALLEATDAEIHACINKVGFWRRKTEYIKKTADILRDRFDGDVPKTIEDLLILPGVGPKMGFLCLQAAWGIQVGIGVDTHVHRITNRLGWHKKPTTDPEETRVNLESWLPQELHGHVNVMLVGLGQTICLPINPRCDLCHLGQMDDSPCPSKRKALVKEARAKLEVGATPSGDVGPVADTASEVQDADIKPFLDIKLETVNGSTEESTVSNGSSYFLVKQEPTSLAW